MQNVTETDELFQPLVGEWVGKSTLILNPDDPGDIQASTASVELAANGQALLVNYAWHVDGAEERGTILVERESQKPIVVGRGGSKIKAIGTDARHELERFFETRVFLDLRVKVRADWREDDRSLDELGVPKARRRRT